MSKEVTKNKTTIDTERLLKLADDTLKTEALALETLRKRFRQEDADHFVESVSLLLNCKGRVVVSGWANPAISAAKSPRHWHRPEHRPCSCILRKPLTATLA